VWNVVIPSAVCTTVERLDCQSVRETMSSQTSDGHTTTCLIQTCHSIPYKRRNTTDSTWIFRLLVNTRWNVTVV